MRPNLLHPLRYLPWLLASAASFPIWAQQTPLPEGFDAPLQEPLVVPAPPIVTNTPPPTTQDAQSQSINVPAAAPNASLPTTIAAGRTPGAFSVGDSGAVSYTIPLWTPPGVGSDQLALALAYSSRGPDGVMGVGWSLVGMSTITRCNRTWAQDGYRQGITLTTSDRLCLDGQQLKVVTGSPSTPAQGGTTFATEIESFSQIVAAGSIGAAPTSLTVTTKNGLIYDYGLTVDSQILAGPSGPIRTWALSQIRDRVGNSIKFSYYNDAESGSGYTDGSYRVKEIDYPYTASGQGPFYSITFSYGGRLSGVNVPSGYIAGSLIQEPNQLNTISEQNYGSSTPTKTYTLNYAENTVSSRLELQTVQECSATNCLPATTITYQKGAQAWGGSIQSTGVESSTQASPIAIDLNGDGLTDLLYPVTATSSTVHWWITFASASGYGSPVDTQLVTNNTDVIIPGAFSGTGQNQFLAPKSGYWYLYTCSASGCTNVDTNVPVNGESFAADYDGDGLPDLVSAVGNTVYVRRNITQPGGAVAFASTPTSLWTAASNLSLAHYNSQVFHSADYNADGRADIFAVTTIRAGVRYNVLFSNGFSAPPTVVTLIGSSTTLAAAGDWNGDGCTDIIGSPTIYISDCAGGFTALAAPTVANGYAILAVDWDGDGNTDFLYNNNGTWYIARSTGTGIAAPVSTGNLAPTSTSWFATDVDGDGLIDLAYVDGNDSNKIKYMLHGAPGTPPDLATSFTDGFAMNQSVTYVPVSQNNYTKYSNASFPEQDYQGPLYVANQFTASDGTGSTYQNQFWYYGARTQVQGRGFEGFYARRTYDTRNQLYTYNYDGQQFPWTGSLLERVVVQTNLSNYITSWQATPSSQITGGSGFEQRTFPFFSSTSESDYEYGGALNGSTIDTISTGYTYADGYGNPTQITTSVTDTDPTSPYYTSVWQTVVNSTYLNDGSSAWCLGLPTISTVEQIIPGQTTQTRTYHFTPDSNHTLCREQQQIIEPATAALTVTTNFGFDSCGNVNSVSVVGHNPDGTAMAARTSNYNYSYFSNRCQLPEQISNALTQSTTISYNYSFGLPLTVTDPNSAPTSWLYDDFGRKNQETRPDGTYSRWTFSYCASDPCFGVTGLRFLAGRYEYDSTGKQYWEQNRYFDGYDRIRYDESDHAFGTWTIDRVFVYDALGRVTRSYQPYSSASNGYWTLGYDPLNRLTQASLYQGNGSLSKTASFGYQGRTGTFTDPLANVTTQITDVSGSLRQVRDPAPGGTTYYTYDAFGNLNQIKDTISAVSSATYNLRGFRTQLVDADAGTWNFSGDSLNELVSWTDMKNQSFGAAYDALGRLTSRTELEGTSTWTWDTMPSGCSGGKYVGQLTIASGYGYTEARCFDSISRLQTQTITTDQAYQFDYSYNTVGAINTLTYPASPPPTGTTATRFEIQYAYSYGVPTQIADITQGTAVPLWTLSAVNDYSSPTSESLGNSVVSIASGYDPPTDNLTKIQSGVSGSTTNRQNLAYTWDVDGNLHERQDLNQSLIEVFTYDSLNRVSSSTLNGQANLSVSYLNTSGVDQAGNIMQSGVGSYAYGDSHHPHGVTAAGSYAFTYDANGNVATRNGLSLGWTSFNLPSALQASVGGSTYSSAFSYGPDHQLFQQNATYSNGTETTTYAGSLLEKVSGTDTGGVTAWRHYVPTPSGLAVIVSRNSNGSTTTAYTLSDHLGSTDAVVSGSSGTSGNLLVQESFGAFGQRRQSNWSAGSPSSGDLAAIAETTRRGFTFQEELDNIALVHMNGRVYDPSVGRFLSADQAIGSLGDSQSINPYSYVGNRPVSFVDPTGEDPATDIGEIVITGGGPEDPVTDVVALVDVAFDLFGLFGGAGAPPPPPPASVSPNASAQSGITSTPCTTPSAECGGGFKEVLVRASRLFNQGDVGKLVAGFGTVVSIDNTPGVMADGTPYLQEVTISAPRTNPTETLGAGAPGAGTGFNYRRVILGSFGLGALEYAPGYDLTNCAVLATSGQFCGAGGLARAAIGTALPGEGGVAAKGGFAALSRAEQFGIKSYAQLGNALKGTGLQAHHLIEDRFAALMGQTTRQGLSVAVTPAEHQVFTNAWRAAIPYGAGTANATVEQVINAARQIYAGYPAILSVLGL